MEDIIQRLTALESKFEALNTKLHELTYNVAYDDEFTKDLGYTSESLKRGNIFNNINSIYEEYIYRNNFNNDITLKYIINDNFSNDSYICDLTQKKILDKPRYVIDIVRSFIENLPDEFENLSLNEKTNIINGFLKNNKIDNVINLDLTLKIIACRIFYLYENNNVKDKDVSFADYFNSMCKYVDIIDTKLLFECVESCLTSKNKDDRINEYGNHMISKEHYYLIPGFHNLTYY